MEDLSVIFIIMEQMTTCQESGIEPLTCFQTVVDQLQQLVDKTETKEMI